MGQVDLIWTVSMLVAIAVQLADVFTTSYALRRLNAKEKNPIVRWMMQNEAWATAKLLFAFCCYIALWASPDFTIGSWQGKNIWLAWIITAIMFLVVLRNLRIIREEERKLK